MGDNMGFKTEIEISSADAFETMKLIGEYLDSNRRDLNFDALERVYDALSEADRIVIVASPENNGDHDNAA